MVPGNTTTMSNDGSFADDKEEIAFEKHHMTCRCVLDTTVLPENMIEDVLDLKKEPSVSSSSLWTAANTTNKNETNTTETKKGEKPVQNESGWTDSEPGDHVF